MNARKCLQRYINFTKQSIQDIESWNDSHQDEDPPLDCEADRGELAIAERAAEQWDTGQHPAAQVTMHKLADYASGELGDSED